MWLADEATAEASVDLAAIRPECRQLHALCAGRRQASLTNKMSTPVQVTISNQPPTAALSLINALTKSSLTGILDSSCERHRFDGWLI